MYPGLPPFDEHSLVSAFHCFERENALPSDWSAEIPPKTKHRQIYLLLVSNMETLRIFNIQKQI